MRISDWSSDVCSSDLRRFIEERRIRRPFRRIGRIERTGKFLGIGIFDPRLQDMAGIEADPEILPDTGQEIEEALHRPLDARERAVAGVALLFDKARLARKAVDIERSEEHTSELQSLMRISYAVFCLKKKK